MSTSVHSQPSRSIWGEYQTCDMCDRRLPTSQMNVPNRIPKERGNIIKPSKLRGMMFVCDDCKDEVFIPIGRQFVEKNVVKASKSNGQLCKEIDLDQRNKK